MIIEINPTLGGGMGRRVGGASYIIRTYEFIWYLTPKCPKIFFQQNAQKCINSYKGMSQYGTNILYPIRLYV
jgi:hypothetical protein